MNPRLLFMLACVAAVCGCDVTDPATRIAHDIETGTAQLGSAEGAAATIRHEFPSKAGECVGPYRVQVDKTGALLVWCKDDGGATVSSHSTSYAARFARAPQTYIVDKPARATLEIDLVRQQGQAVVSGVR